LKIFLLKPSSLGDVVQALPVLRLLKQHFPTGAIFWWADASLAPLLEGDPNLAGVIRFERQRWVSPWHWPEALRSLRAIRAHRFDWVIDLQSLARSGAVAWLADAELTVGLDDSREGARGFYDVIVPRPSPATHAVDWYLSVLPALGVPAHGNFVWLPERPPVAAAVRAQWPVTGARWIALHPGARWLNKRWPAEHFAELVGRFTSAPSEWRFAILGHAADRALAGRIAAAAPSRCLDLTGRTSLPEMVEWLRLCDALVTNDSGPMHVAAALGKPVLALFGPTDPRRTGPYGQLDHVLQLPLPCVPCLKASCAYHQPFECLRALTPAAVSDRLKALLAERAVPSPA
jgi:lipopolysaccharide heptosyltransferase II